jgi:hypothetical protein
MLTELEKAYIAGFFDGEGCISLGYKKDTSYRRHHTYQLVVTVANTNKEILNFLHQRFGGHFRKGRPPSKNGKEVYVWALLCRKALKFLEEIYPYLRLKKKQAELAFEYYKLVNPYGNHTFDSENWKKRDEIYYKLKALNKRGKSDDRG